MAFLITSARGCWKLLGSPGDFRYDLDSQSVASCDTILSVGIDCPLLDRRSDVVPKHQENTMPNTVRFHRVLRTAAEKVYKAFIDPDAMAKWLPPNGFTGKVHEMDARVGGGHRMSFTNFSTGKSHSFGGRYVELTPGERICYTDRFDDPNLPGEMRVTVTLKKVSVGTELMILQER